MHIGSPRSYRYQPAWNENWEKAREQIIALNPNLLLVGGDMTRDGATHRFELEQAKRNFDAMPFPVHCIPGNHEVGNKFSPDSDVAIQSAYRDLYRSVFGASEWTFVYNDVRFSGFDAFLLGSGLEEEQQLMEWLEAQRNEPRMRRHVWIMHPALFADDPDEADWNRVTDRTAWYFVLDREYRYQLFDLFHATGTTHVITSHIHCRRYVRFNDTDIHFAPSTAFPQWGDRWQDGDATLGFLHFSVSDEDIACDFVPLAKRSEAKGYGPGGNPSVDGRDYSVSWEKPPLSPEE